MINSKYLELENIHLFDFDKFLIDPINSIQKLSKVINLDYNKKVNDFVELNVKRKILKTSNIKESNIQDLYEKLLNRCVN